MHTSEHGVYLIESFEGFSSVLYYDSVGVATIGFGTTSADISPLPHTCTRAQAEGWLRSKLASKYEPAVQALRNWQPSDQNRFDALVSLAYNCGPGSMSWQIGRDVRAGNWAAAAGDFMHYVYAGGQVLQGLVNRRRAEQHLFETPFVPPPPPDPDWYHPNEMLSGTGLNEHQIVKQTEGALQHPQRYKAYLKCALRPHLKLLRDRCYKIAKYQPPRYSRLRAHAVWSDDRHFGARWQHLNNLMKQIDKIR